ncbi:type II toxin-antitoxin system VapC family toxin [Candidatus Woesearchaeota archaeon]|nr:type II toxin-antitoxin system VapC family toxin [Candidatus Woesearchaeota archaeon]
MNYLLDTDIAIEYLRGNPTAVEKLGILSFENLYISSISVAELFYGVYDSKNIKRHLAGLLQFLEKVEIINLNLGVCQRFGQTKAELRKRGRLLDNFDLLIGAMCLCNGSILLTNNNKHYQRIQGIKIVNIR